MNDNTKPGAWIPPDKALRHNVGKPELSYIASLPYAWRGFAAVCAYGAKKYFRFNYLQGGAPYSQHFDCLLRHLSAWWAGEELDPESGLHHLDHAVWNALVLSENARVRPEDDDRPTAPSSLPSTAATTTRLVYLASPYSHPEKEVREARFRAVSRYAARLAKEGIPVFCPIAHSHPWAEYGELDDVDHDFWMRVDEPFILLCTELWVLQLPGWEESRGVQAEVERFRQARKPVVYRIP